MSKSGHFETCAPLLITILTAVFLAVASGSTVALVIAHDRSSHLKKTLRSLAAARNSSELQVFVSVDDNPRANRAIRAAEFEPNTAGIWHQPAPPEKLSSREKIADHYYHALRQAFSDTTTQYVIVVEDDLLVSPDFITFLQAAIPNLSSSAPGAIVCASGWNDNAFAEAPADEWCLTSFFPGLGWVLHRSLWDELVPLWPHSNNTSTIVGIGWDFWLRILFDERNWSCITPRLSRVKHLGSGANVNSAAAQTYTWTKVATKDVDWHDFHVDLGKEIHRVQEWLDTGTLITSLAQVKQANPERPILMYRREAYADIAAQLGLWPTPRGHFRHTLRGSSDRNEILLFDERRAEKHWVLPSGDVEDILLVRSAVNASCDEACAQREYECDTRALERSNECQALQAEFDCRGCSYETGADMPAFVVADAPLSTAGWCLIAEMGVGPRGGLLCEGRFQWTQRLCGCVRGDGPAASGTGVGHDEL